MIPTSRQESQSSTDPISRVGYYALASIKVLSSVTIVLLFGFLGSHYILFYATVLKTRPLRIIFKKETYEHLIV